MTIDEKDIEVLSDIIVGFEQGYHIAPSKERIAVLHKTLDTMRKYQKIEQIAEKYNLQLLPKEGMNGFQREILEVLNDES